MNELKPNNVKTNVSSTSVNKVTYKAEKLVIDGYDFSDCVVDGFDFGLCVDWKKISDINIFSQLSDDFIEKFKTKLNWNIICEQNDLSVEFVKKYKEQINWGIFYKRLISKKQFFETFSQLQDIIGYTYVGLITILQSYYLDESILYMIVLGKYDLLYKKQQVCKNVFAHQKLSDDFVISCSDFVEEFNGWSDIIKNNKLKEETVLLLGKKYKKFKYHHGLLYSKDMKKHVIDDKQNKNVLFEAPEKKSFDEIIDLVSIMVG